MCRIRSTTPCIAAAALALAACSGTIEPGLLAPGEGQPPAGPGQGEAPMRTPTEQPMPGPIPGPGSSPAPVPDPPPAASPGLSGKGLQRLSVRQVMESFKSLGVDPSSLGSLMGGERPDFLNALDAPFKVEEIELFDRLATTALPTFEARYGGRLNACVAGEDAARPGCVAGVVTQAALDLWGIGPADDGAGLAGGYLQLTSSRGEPQARASLFRALATDPEFLFLVRVAPSTPARGTALFKRWASYSLTRGPRAAAADARAARPAPLEGFVQNLVGQGDFREMAFAFYQHFLHVEPANALVKDPTLYGFFNAHFINNVVFGFRDHMLGSLGSATTPFTAPLWGPVTLTRSLPGVYGPPAASAYGTAATERVGAFSHPLVLASLSANNDTVPLHNGVLFLDGLLCQLPPPPPINPDSIPFEEDPARSRRDNFEARTKGAACRGCHQTLNPVSFAFEMFDATGRLRPDSDVASFAAGGTLTLASGRTVSFANAMDLVKQIKDEPQVIACHVQRWAEHLNGGPLDAEQERALAPALALASAGGSLRDVLKTIVLQGKFD